MALRKVVDRFTKPVEELDRAALVQFCDALGVIPMDTIVERRPVRIAGEITSVRIVPRAGAPALEVTLSDGRGAATAVFLGRRKVAGVNPGRRIIVEGVAGRAGTRYLIFNPFYTLLP